MERIPDATNGVAIKYLADLLYKICKIYRTTNYSGLCTDNTWIIGMKYKWSVKMSQPTLTEVIIKIDDGIINLINHTIINFVEYCEFYKFLKDNKFLKKGMKANLYKYGTSFTSGLSSYIFEFISPDGNDIKTFKTDYLDNTNEIYTSTLSYINDDEAFMQKETLINKYIPMFRLNLNPEEFVRYIIEPKNKHEDMCSISMSPNEFNINDKFVVGTNTNDRTKLDINKDAWNTLLGPTWFYISRNIVPKELLLMDSMNSLVNVEIRYFTFAGTNMNGMLTIEMQYPKYKILLKCIVSCITDCRRIS